MVLGFIGSMFSKDFLDVGKIHSECLLLCVCVHAADTLYVVYMSAYIKAPDAMSMSQKKC